MNTDSKKIIRVIVIVLVVAIAGYGAYLLYNSMLDNATRRIKQGVSEGVSGGIGNAINPAKMPFRFFGGGN